MKENTAKNYMTYHPAADVLEMENGWSLFLDVPGAVNEMLDIDVEDNVLRIKAESMLTQKNMTVRYERAFQLSDEVDAGGIKAELKDGVLHLMMPKAESAKPRKIKVLTA